jgi:glucose-1-phosphate thymidylyltransferase
MKALIASGGFGTRLRPFTFSMPKQLIPIADRPILEHVLGNIREAGVTDAVVVVGDWAPEIAAAMGDGSRLGMHLTYIRQEKPLGLAHCVELARDYLGDDDFVMYLGDNILPDGIVKIMEKFRVRRPAAQIVVKKVDDARAFGVAELDQNGDVRRLVEKPQQPGSDLAILGVYFFTAAIHEAVAAIMPSGRAELEITDAIQWLLAHGSEVKAVEYHGYWKDAGRIDDLLDCNRRLLGDLRRSVSGEVDAASELRGQVVTGPGVSVVRSRIEGPVIIGANTVLEECRIGPNVSIGQDCVLRSTHLTDSIVMDGASISVAAGLHDSIIGRYANVGRSRRGAKCHHLVVGEDGLVEIAS